MAYNKWVSTTGNGAAGASWSSGSVPTAGDTVVFDGTSQVSWTSGLDASSWGVVVFRTTEAFTGDIGTAGTPVTLYGEDGAGTEVIYHHFHHSGQLFLNLTSAAPPAGLAHVDVRNPSRDRTRYSISGSFNSLTVRGGGATLESTLTLDSVVRVYGPSSNVLIESGFTNNGTTEVYGGVVENQSAEVPTVYGGVMIEKTQRSGFTLYGGTIDYRPTTPSNITTLNLYDGTFIVAGDAVNMLNTVVGPSYIGPNAVIPGVPQIRIDGVHDFRAEFP